MADYIAGISDMPIMIPVMSNPHSSHPSLGHLTLLVFEAVMEVVCVSLPGYIIARLGHFDADMQKFLANLNVMLFTPCLIFTKLASQLDADKFSELMIIPVIFVVMTVVSYTVSLLVSKVCGFNRRASNFVIAMGVFGNSNSLPISLVLSLSQTLKGLHWDRIPGDNDDEVAARGILYLMIFQQLGQLVRWSWGYHVLLAPKSKYKEYDQITAEEGAYRDDSSVSDASSISDDSSHHAQNTHGHRTVLVAPGPQAGDVTPSPCSDTTEVYEPAGRTPVAPRSVTDSDDEEEHGSKGHKNQDSSVGAGFLPRKRSASKGPAAPQLHQCRISLTRSSSMSSTGAGYSYNHYGTHSSGGSSSQDHGEDGVSGRLLRRLERSRLRANKAMAARGRRVYEALPRPLQVVADGTCAAAARVNTFVWEFMNPPLWAMLLAVVVASFPRLKTLFFAEGSFIKNSVTSAVAQSGGVAVPIILVVLGANLARNTQTHSGAHDDHDSQSHGSDAAEEAQIGKKLLVASLVSRMVLPTLFMAPILALFAKYVPISILDDPIFVIVCFLLTGAPSALQLAQICQINGVYESTMSNVLFQSYVVWILPSTLVLVMCALEVVEWAQ